MKRKHLGLPLGVFLTLSGCYPNGLETAQDTDLAAAFHGTSFDFTTAGTFAIPDFVVKISRGKIINRDILRFLKHEELQSIITGHRLW